MAPDHKGPIIFYFIYHQFDQTVLIFLFFTFQTKMPLITVKRHKYSMVDIKTIISSKHRLSLIDSIKSMVITIKTTDLKRHRLYPTETHENRRQSTILPMKSFVWVMPIICS